MPFLDHLVLFLFSYQSMEEEYLHDRLPALLDRVKVRSYKAMYVCVKCVRMYLMLMIAN